MKSKLPLIVAVVLGIISFAGIGQYLNKRMADTNVVTAPILVAAVDKKAGETLTRAEVRPERIPQRFITQMGKVYKPGDEALIDGSLLSKDLKAGEPIYPVALMGSQMRAEGKRFVRLLQKEERAISLPVEGVGAIGMFLKPGDRVDILSNLEIPKTETKTYSVPNQGVVTSEEVSYYPSTVFLLENVRVLAVGGEFLDPEAPEGLGNLGMAGGGVGGSTAITFAVTPDEAQILSFTMRHGSAGGAGSGTGEVTFTLLLRPVGDNTTVPERRTVQYEDFLNLTRLKELQENRNRRVPREPTTEQYLGGVLQPNSP